MKKLIALAIAVVAFLHTLIGCDSSGIEVGTKNGLAHFDISATVPRMILEGENETEIEDKNFFGKLVAAIDDKSTVDPVCDCQPIYNVGIDKYIFGLHTHGITISSPMGKNIIGRSVFAVECTEEEISELLRILVSIDSTSDLPVYPGLPDINDDPLKGIEIYCWQDGGEWKCGGLEGTNRQKFDEEIRALQIVTIPQMKAIIEKKGLTDCFRVILIDLSDDEVVYLDVEKHGVQIALLELQLGAER